MDLFTDITGHPVFSKTIREVVYDGRLYLPSCHDPQGFRAEYINSVDAPVWAREGGFVSELDGMVDSAGNVKLTGRPKELHDRYQEMLSEQEDIIDSGKDLKVLCNGLSRISNIDSISIADEFNDFGVLQLKYEEHSWYAERTKEQPPIAKWEVQCYKGPTCYPMIFDWSWRGIEHFFFALAKFCRSVTRVGVGFSYSWAPTRIFRQGSAACNYLLDIANQISALRLHCTIPEWSRDSFIEGDELAGLHSLITQAAFSERLESLCFRMPDLDDMVHASLGLINLKMLSLGDIYLSLTDFSAIAAKSQYTLKILLLGGATAESNASWREIAKYCSQVFRLQRVELQALGSHDLLDEPGLNNYMTCGELRSIACTMLEWADQTAILVDLEDMRTQHVRLLVDTTSVKPLP